MNRLDLPVTYNFRPVSGLQPGSLYRSDSLARLRRAGRAGLRDLGVRRVIDLRSDFDRRLGGADRLRGVPTDLMRIPMLSGAKKSDVYDLTLERIYRHLLDHNQAAVGAVVRAVADAPEGAVVVHCTAGKDRSGLTAALIQLAVGVDDSAVLEDYARTQPNLEGVWADRMRRRVRRFGIRMTPALERVLVASPREALEDALGHLSDAHGGLDAYLARAGVTDDHRGQLRARLGAD